MSIQTELTRLQNAKSDLRSAIQSKGVTVPSAATLDNYGALVEQIETGDMHKAVYDPQGKNQDIFAYGPHLYKATLLLDGWSEESPYTQTVAVQAVDGGPGITSGSLMTSPVYFDDTVQGEAREALEEAVSLVNGGHKTFGAGTITCVIQGEKPLADAEVYFNARKGGV